MSSVVPKTTLVVVFYYDFQYPAACGRVFASIGVQGLPWGLIPFILLIIYVYMK